jgi:hypothetical protein
MSACHHEFAEAVYDPTTTSVPYGSQLVRMGSDSYYEPQGYEQKSVARWSRTCKKCGKVEYTEKQEPIIVGSRPKF